MTIAYSSLIIDCSYNWHVRWKSLIFSSHSCDVCHLLAATCRSSINYSWLLFLFWLEYLFLFFFNFSGEWLNGFCCNFADMFKFECYLNFILEYFRVVWFLICGLLSASNSERFQSRLIADTKSYLYINKGGLPCSPVECNF